MSLYGGMAGILDNITEETDHDIEEEEPHHSRPAPPPPRQPPRRAPTAPSRAPPSRTAAPPSAPTHRPPPPPPSAPRSVLPMKDVSGDKTTKSRAISSFVSDPSMASTFEKVTTERPSTGFDTASMVAPGRAGGAGSRSRAGYGASASESRKEVVEQRRSALREKRKQAQQVQQLRGIFAAFDENRDGVLTKEELANALLALGIRPTPKVIQKYQIGSSTGVIDLPTFISVSMTRLKGVETTMDQILVAFSEFDTDKTGVVSSSIIRHLLNEVSSETALTSAEAEDLLKMTGIVSKDGPFLGLGVNVDYRELINKMMFVPS